MDVQTITVELFGKPVYITTASAYECGASFATTDPDIRPAAAPYYERSRTDLSQREVGVEIWVGNVCVERSTRFEDDPSWEITARELAPVVRKILAPSKA